MAITTAKCTQCGKYLSIDDTNEAEICPFCNRAFVTEKAIKFYNANSEEEKRLKQSKESTCGSLLV